MKLQRAKHVIHMHNIATAKLAELVVTRDAKVKHHETFHEAIGEMEENIANNEDQISGLDEQIAILQDQKKELVQINADLSKKIKNQPKEAIAARIDATAAQANVERGRKEVAKWHPELEEARKVIADIEEKEATRRSEAEANRKAEEDYFETLTEEQKKEYLERKKDHTNKANRDAKGKNMHKVLTLSGYVMLACPGAENCKHCKNAKEHANKK